MTDPQRACQSDSLLQIERIQDEWGITLGLRGELDLSSAPELDRQLAEVQRENPDRLLIDLSNLEFMDSTGLALIIAAEQAARQNGHRLHLRSGSPQVQRLFELTGILDRFTFEDEREPADERHRTGA